MTTPNKFMHIDHICGICGLGIMVGEDGDKHCNFCDQMPPSVPSKIDWKILAKRILEESRDKASLDGLFLPYFIATQLKKPESMAELKSNLPKNIADRITLQKKAGLSYSLSFWL